MNAIRDQLLAEQQEPARYAFGARLAQLAGENRGRNRPTLETQATAYRLGRKVAQLVESQHPQDTFATNSIARRFLAKDAASAAVAVEAPRSPIQTTEDFNIVRWLADASCGELTAFSIWNNQRRNQLQHRLNTLHPELQSNTSARVEQLIELDIFPQEARQHYQNTFTDYGPLRAIDTFEAGMLGADGYAMPTYIGIPNLFNQADFSDYPQYLDDVVFHEYLHGAGFGEGRGFFSGIWSNPTVVRWLEEHTASHLTSITAADAAVTGAKPGAYLPRPGLQETLPYYLESYFVETLGNIPVDLLGHAYMTPRTTPQGERLRRDLENRLAKAMGSQALLFDFTDTYEAALTRSDRQDLLLKEIQRRLDSRYTVISDKEPAGAVGVISFKDND